MSTTVSSPEQALMNQKICGRYHLERMVAESPNTEMWTVRDDEGRRYHAKLTTLGPNGRERTNFEAEVNVFVQITGGEIRRDNRFNLATPCWLPNVFFYGRHQNICDVIVTQRIFPCMATMVDDAGWRSMVTTTGYLMLADDMILGLMALHRHGFVHRNVHLNNFGLNSSCNLTLLNFSVAKRYRDPIAERHVPMTVERSFTGSLRYASVNAHLLMTQSRRDDLISVGYCIIDAMKRMLPWDGVSRNDKISVLSNNIWLSKTTTPLEVLCHGLPNGILFYMQTVTSMEYSETPNYKDLRKMIKL